MELMLFCGNEYFMACKPLSKIENRGITKAFSKIGPQNKILNHKDSPAASDSHKIGF